MGASTSTRKHHRHRCHRRRWRQESEEAAGEERNERKVARIERAWWNHQESDERIRRKCQRQRRRRSVIAIVIAVMLQLRPPSKARSGHRRSVALLCIEQPCEFAASSIGRSGQLAVQAGLVGAMESAAAARRRCLPSGRVMGVSGKRLARGMVPPASAGGAR